MPVFWLTKDHVFPHPELANDEGILAIGGDLHPDRLVLAYEKGIFPWYSPGEPIIWWSPDPRFVLFPEKVKVSKSMRQILRKGRFQVTVNKSFKEVMIQCQQKRRKGQSGTWITEEMITAYEALHTRGIAHSVEVWDEGKLVGGLYGLAMGKCFFGESMFSHKSNASKAGFLTMVKLLEKQGFYIIDCQVHTHHLESLGAGMISRKEFQTIIANHTTPPLHWQEWTDLEKFPVQF
ncbi:MAG: leucyl/phenylalanyl-tRNA--protein transferase [Bacteroidota bacterium]